ncbi:MAG: potassium/proton antiporter [Planctomycetota bacterium]|jgi:cell volume regulation protein A
MPPIESLILVMGALIFAGILASILSERLSVPALLLFLVVGMLAGSEGFGGIEFDSPKLAYAIGTVALLVILFSGGLESSWSQIRPVLVPGLILSTCGVVITALALGTFAWFVLGTYSTFDIGMRGLTWMEALLIASIVSSTDAAAVFAVFRSSSVLPRQNLRYLLEFESGSNDPMAVLMTTVILQAMTQGASSIAQIITLLVLRFLLGGGLGCAMGFVATLLVDRIALKNKGLTSILVLAMGFVTFGLADLIGGNGFLAIYAAGVVIGNRIKEPRLAVLEFHNGLSWLFQIIMFIMLGLLVFPSGLLSVVGVSVAMALFLMLIARPLSVFVCMWPFRMKGHEKAYLSWAGLRGSVPIVLATFPLSYDIEGAETIFNVIFFVVIISVLIQGVTLVPFARWLKIAEEFN